LDQHTFDNNTNRTIGGYDFKGINSVMDEYCTIIKLDSLIIIYPNHTHWNESHPLSNRLNMMFEKEKFSFYRKSLESVYYAISNKVYFDIIIELKKDLDNKNLSVEEVQLILYVCNTLYYESLIRDDQIKC